MPNFADRRLRIAAARADFLASGRTGVAEVPELVVASWLRSASAGVDAGLSAPRFHVDLDTAGRLMRSAQPIIDRLGEESADVALSIALTDAHARILHRYDTERTIGMLLDRVEFAPGFDYAEDGIGTNGVGTVFESGQPVQIVGPEHFVERLQSFSCSGAPIKNPLTGRVEGVLDITCLTEHSSPLMHSLVRSAAHDIERNILLDHSLGQQALFETFIRCEARSRGAVLAVGPSVEMANSQTHVLFDAAEQRALREHASYMVERPGADRDELDLESGKRVRIEVTQVRVGPKAVGVVLNATVVDGSVLGVLPAQPGVGHRGVTEARPPVVVADAHNPAWRRAYAEMWEAFEYRDAVLVLGESGVGKSTIAVDVFDAMYPHGTKITADLADTDLNSSDLFGTNLEASSGPVLLVLRHLDLVEPEALSIIEQLLDQAIEHPERCCVAATMGEGMKLDTGLQSLLTRFARSVTLPPLRHRRDDLQGVISRMLTELVPGRQLTVDESAMALIMRQEWPANLWQLRETLLIALRNRPVGAIRREDLPGHLNARVHRSLSPIESAERDAIVRALQESEGNRVQAAKSLGIGRATLYRKLRHYSLSSS